ncbi:hypothetical protein FGU71_11060 [Erythrobacter insulae]|uniref:DUF3455 domain-containing protein n=1 Tax=Erythrobacter insulae TaxID=2584124 RepID=A0A547PDX7_9SPHN|nr:hypothetical protein [Erythrobacter insulae]TRD12351.1 hypothetical protein FGU71_11060 [Erythrobacter insulae]
MRFFPLFCLTVFAAPAAAHDATLVYVEAMEAHILDCPAVNGFAPEGDMLSVDWVKRDVNDPVLANHAAKFKAEEQGLQANVNVFTKTVEGMELIQFMAIRSMEAVDGQPSVYVEGQGNIGATEYLCVTMVPDLPFMPSGKLLGAVFGKDVDAGIGNSPGDLRNGTWVWDKISPTHIRTIARYTNSFTGQTDLPDDVFYPGFYILSFRKFTPEQSNQDSEQP